MPPIPDLPIWTQLLLAVLTGGIGSQLLSRLWLSKKEKTDAAHQFRTELQAAVSQMSDRLDRLQKEVDEWREKYFQIKEENLRLRAELDLINPKPAFYTRDLPAAGAPFPLK